MFGSGMMRVALKKNNHSLLMAVKNTFINYNSLSSDIQSQHIDMLTHTPSFTDKAYASPRLKCMFELALLKISSSDIS